MKISAINNKNINFNGLWEDTKYKGQTNYKTGLHEIRETRTYRPFADEDIREVKEFVKGMNHLHDDYCSRTRSFAKVGETLPFTEAEYWNYQSKTDKHQLSEKEWTIDDFARNLFLTSEPFNQEPAQNLFIEA